MKRETELTAIMRAMDEAGVDTASRPLTRGLKPLAGRLPAPALGLPDLYGRRHDIKDYWGKVTLVHFWSTWCQPFRMEMASLELLARKMRGEDFAILAVNVGEQADSVRLYTQQVMRGLSFPVLLDTHARAMEAWKVGGLPTSFLLDHWGKVAYTAVGGRDFDHPEMERIIRALGQP